ncbi:uncharacterized protein LOC126366715 [Pectinophora gossypiella]|uniref:uncharacterized protein LOC126366715 n=1 Tax=Pectinophora gossypiella TaxID=13191 RepID=UPI00214F4770|nr:uncharacterized protein LOC126366715 [Pectinophora gossypiella]
MGSGQSVRATHFQNKNARKEPAPDPDDEPETHHISISNKMVERLVEDAALSGGTKTVTVAQTPKKTRSDHKERVLIERLRSLDDAHSERTGLTMDEVKATAKRVEMRTSNLSSVEPVCAEYADRVIECYLNSPKPQDASQCWDTVANFSRCVQESATHRLRARTEKEARDAERRSRNISQALPALQDHISAPPEIHS